MHQKKYLSLATKALIRMFFLLIFISFFSVNLYAFNAQFLKDAAVAEFSNEDYDLLLATLDSALNHNEDGASSKWDNPQTGHSGIITPLDSSVIKNMQCRKVKIINHAKNNHGQPVFTFCKVDNQWKILK